MFFYRKAIGSCRISLSISSVQNNQNDSPLGGSIISSSASSHHFSSLPSPISIGSKVSFVLSIDDVKGPSSIDFSSFHSQCRLTSFAGSSVRSEDIYHSSAVDLTRHAPSYLSFRRQFSLVITPDIDQHWRNGYAPIEFFAKVNPAYLERLSRWDETRESEEKDTGASHLRPILAPATENGLMRRSESEFVQTQLHDVSCYLEVCEIGSSGDYSPVTVLSQSFLDPGAFYLQQGLQRRVKLFLVHNSGSTLPWTKVSQVSLGNVRLLGDKGQILESSSRPSVELKLDNTQPVSLPDGSSSLAAAGFWDSSLHDSLFLNRPTTSNQRVLLRIMFLVEISTCEKPAVFTQDIAVRILSRGVSGPGIFSTGFFSSARLLTRTSSIFAIHLAPPPTRSAGDLWRLDTSKAYVKGEEVLSSSWKPRGVTVVQDHLRLVKTERNAADVRVIKALLAACGEEGAQGGLDEEKEKELLEKSVEFWMKRLGPKEEVSDSSYSSAKSGGV